MTAPEDGLRTVRSLLARHGGPRPSEGIERLGEGEFVRAYVVDGQWVVRVAKHQAAAEALAREACLLPSMAPLLPVQVPCPTFAFGGEGPDAAFVVYPMLPGLALTRERYQGLSEPARDRCARAVGSFLATLHGMELDLPRACDVPEVDYRARHAELWDRARTVLPSRLPRQLWYWIESIFTEALRSAARESYRPVLLHGDLSPDHVLYDPLREDVTGIIDFGDVAIGDPAWDLVYIYEDYGPDFLTRLLGAYPAAGIRGLLQRMQHLLELDAVDWAVGRAVREDRGEMVEAEAYLAQLQFRASVSPWSGA